jgi:hypothetical protein
MRPRKCSRRTDTPKRRNNDPHLTFHPLNPRRRLPRVGGGFILKPTQEDILSAQHIYVSAPLGSIIRYSDGTPKPPARFKRKLAAWENYNSGGKLVRKTPSRDMPSCFLPAGITLHQGDFGSAGVVVLRVDKTFSVDCATFTVSEPPKPGSVRVLDREGEAAELLHLAIDRTAAEAWLAAHRHPGAVLEEITAAEVAAAVIEGRAA